jgi:cytochrome P450
LFWELAKHQTWQDKLREEVRAHSDSSPTFQQVQDLPILEAVIDEALRLHPAAPASLPRETPSGGRELNGFFIPEKVRISRHVFAFIKN